MEDLIIKGLRCGIVKIIQSRNDGCIACEIGEYWFYFIGDEYENMTPNEVFETFTDDELCELILNAIKDLDKDEQLYYQFYLKENLKEKILNTMNSFEEEGFKIVRDGKIITLTQEEMSDFRYLDKAIDGLNCLRCYGEYCESLTEEKTLKTLMNDEEVCFNIEDDYLNVAFSDTGELEREIIKKYIKRNIKKRRMIMLDLNKNIIDTEGVIMFDNHYIAYQERSDEYGIDYTILDKDLNVVDGGIFTYGDYNEKTELYDINNGTKTVTLKEFFDYINEDSRNYNFNEYGIEIISKDILDIIQDNI